jgi:Spy/CpxP family protein refolding chaperone
MQDLRQGDQEWGMRRLQQAIRKMYVQEEIGKFDAETVATIKGERGMRAKYSISIIVAAVALLAFTLPVPAFSQMKDMPMKGHGGGHGQMMEMGTMEKMGNMMGMCMEHAEMMGLTDDQVMKMKPVHTEMQKKQARFKADKKIAEIELMEIMEVKDFDLEKASAAVKKIADIKTAHHLEMLKAMKEMRTVLTDEQYKKMKKMMPMKMDEKKPAKKMMKKQ